MTDLYSGVPAIAGLAPFPLGDVHPCFHNGRLYVFYLKTGGGFESALLSGESFFSLKPTELTHADEPPKCAYYVLNAVQDGRLFRSFYGAGKAMLSSESDDLTEWRCSDAYAENTFQGGGRDPFLLKLPGGRFGLISLAYRENTPALMDCSLVLCRSAGRSASSWEPQQTELLRFRDGRKGEPEVPQVTRIGNRLYVSASMAYRTVHHVGPLSYFAAEPGVSLSDARFRTEDERLLCGEDLCAPQLFPIGRRCYMLGWIPFESRGSKWGGALALPCRVAAKPDGSLYTFYDRELKSALLAQPPAASAVLRLNTGGAESFELDCGSCALRFCGTDGTLSFVAPDGFVLSSFRTGFKTAESLFLAADGDILQAELNCGCVLTARADGAVSRFTMTKR